MDERELEQVFSPGVRGPEHPIGEPGLSDVDLETFFAGMERRRRRNLTLLFAGPICFVASLVLWDLYGETASRWARGEIDLRGRWVYTPPHPRATPPGPKVLRRLHTHDLPNWVIAYNLTPRAAAIQMDEIIKGLRDPNLRQILQELQEHTQQDLVGQARRIFYLVWAWNRYMDSLGSPWRLDASMRAAPRRVLFVKSYRATHDLHLRVGSAELRTRLLLRADGTNIVENYLGCTDAGGGGSFVVLDTIHSFVSDHVWPMLAHEPSGLSELQRRFAPGVRQEARRVLGGQHLAVLSRRARARSTLVAAVRAINGRHHCGHDVGLNFVPFNGYSRSWQRRFYHLAAQSSADPCPAVTATEAANLSRASQRLRTQRGLAPAVRTLSAWFARGVAAHEARHVADEMDPAIREQGPACPGCPDSLGPLARAELSAFLASFALPGSGYLHLYQACITASRAPSHPHGKAVNLASRRLDNACEAGPPAQLYRRAAALRRQLFGSDEQVTLPADFPTEVPLPQWAE